MNRQKNNREKIKIKILKIYDKCISLNSNSILNHFIFFITFSKAFTVFFASYSVIHNGPRHRITFEPARLNKTP